MAITENGKCRILTLNNQGLGTSKTDFGDVFLPYTLAGELVEFERHKYRNASNCVLKKILEPSDRRVDPPCKYFGVCGGCLLQHLNKNDYSEFKYNIIVQALTTHNIETDINPVITIPPGLRRRANLEAIKKNDQIFLGFHRFHSNQIINLDECPALLPELSDLIKPLKEVLYQILEQRQKAQIFLTKANNGIDLSMSIQEQKTLDNSKQLLLSDFAEKNGIIRLIFRYRRKINIVYKTQNPYIIFDDIKVDIDAQGFLQSSFMSDQILTSLVLKYFDFSVSKGELQNTVDLFCGRGTYTLPLSRFSNIDAFESDKIAINALKNAVIENNLPITVLNRDLFNTPLNHEELNKYHFAVINPPRAGSETQCQQLSTSKVKKICYISCNAHTFARDAQILCSGNYQLVEVTPVDQFYWSPHLEIVGFFSMKNS